METQSDQYGNISKRKDFIKTGLITIAGIATLTALSECKDKEEGEEKEVSPPEDLMQEHGLLNRVLLIYDTCKIHLVNKESFPMEAITNAAGIVRTFVEDYHEKQEENYLFPRFEKANQLTDLVQTLRQQHKAGRVVTDQITGSRHDSPRRKTVILLRLTPQEAPKLTRLNLQHPPISHLVTKLRMAHFAVHPAEICLPKSAPAPFV